MNEYVTASPISNVEWVDVEKLSANDYNPNVVFNKELKLLEFSILRNGWIQPILVTQDYVVIDGFHRSSLARTSAKIKAKYNGLVPVVVMNLTEPERMLLTIRINRAKGSHIAIKMADIVKTLVNEHEIPVNEIAEEIGATKDEIDLLLMDNVFKALDIQNHKYSKAWYPK
jgi:ParB-like chromosome segregation protein Spo0J